MARFDKRVATPPALVVDAESIRLIFQHPEAMRAEQEGTYLHWDELRHRTPPSGLSHPVWWTAVRLARGQMKVPLALVDSHDRAFSFVMSDIGQRLVHSIDCDARGLIELPEEVTNKATRDRYVVNSLIEEAFRSSQLEGAATTRAVAKEMIRSKRQPRNQSERMILNNFKAMEWVREHHHEPLTRAAIFELHTIVTKGTLDVEAGAGRFRRDDEVVRVIDVNEEVVHIPPSESSLPGRMELMCAFANGSSRDPPFIHPVVRAILLHFWLAYDHPFVDGNGRTARLLFYWSMLRQKYWLTEFISISRVIKKAPGQYARAFLFSESDTNDATYFLLNQLDVLRKAIDDLHAYLKRKAKEVRDVEDLLRGRDDLNNRQLALVGSALRNPDARFTIEGHQTSHRVVYQTARTDLLKLVEHGLLDQVKIGKKLYFSPVTELHRKLTSAKRSG